MTIPANERLSAKDYAYERIKEEIIKGVIEPDTPLINEELSERLEISRTPLREALLRLEHDDLVIRQHNGRQRVAPLSKQEVEELFAARSSLEGILVSEATEKVTEASLNKLSIYVRMIEETAGENAAEEILQYGSEFHGLIYELSGNRTVTKLLRQLNDRIHRYRWLIPRNDTERLLESAREHRMILEYMQSNDREGAEAAMKEHILNSLDAVVVAIQHLQADPGGDSLKEENQHE